MSYQISTANDYLDLLVKVKSEAEANGWTTLQWTPGSMGSSESTWVAVGSGISGSDQIYIGIQTYSNPSQDRYGWIIGVFTGYLGSNTFFTQPGGYYRATPLWNHTTPYWLIVNAQRISIAAKISTVYVFGYFGKYLPYATPGQYPYPVACIAPLPSNSQARWSDTSYTNYQWNIRGVDGGWRTVSSWPTSWPPTYIDTQGVWPLLPLILWESTPNIYGELDGILFTTGFNNSVENTITDSNGIVYVVLQDVYRTSIGSYVAMRLQ